MRSGLRCNEKPNDLTQMFARQLRREKSCRILAGGELYEMSHPDLDFRSNVLELLDLANSGFELSAIS